MIPRFAIARLASLAAAALVIQTALPAAGQTPVSPTASRVVSGTAPAGLQTAADVSARPIVYRQNPRGTPGTRIIGQTRGTGTVPLLTTLAPFDTGETTLAQPTLYWFVSRPVNAMVEVTIVEEATQKTVLEVTTEGPVEPGIWAFPLGIHRIALVPDVEYRWSVALVRDQNRRSLDLFASGTILRVNLPAHLSAQLNKVGPADMPYFLANAGLWYDALTMLSVQIANNPRDRALRETRASLLEQVGLSEAAAFDRVL